MEIIDNMLSVVFREEEEGCGDSGNSLDSNGEAVDVEKQ